MLFASGWLVIWYALFLVCANMQQVRHNLKSCSKNAKFYVRWICIYDRMFVYATQTLVFSYWDLERERTLKFSKENDRDSAIAYRQVSGGFCFHTHTLQTNFQLKYYKIIVFAGQFFFIIFIELSIRMQMRLIKFRPIRMRIDNSIKVIIQRFVFLNAQIFWNPPTVLTKYMLLI